MKWIEVGDGAVPDDVVTAVCGTLRRGGCVVLPTDTVYGLAAALASTSAVERLFALKGRPAAMPIAVLVDSESQAWETGRPTSVATALAGRHWPGALTIVVEGHDELGVRLGATDGSVGIRCPEHGLIRAVAREVGPIATTSANRHGDETPVDARPAAAVCGEVDLVVDGGPCDGAPSTVVDARGDDPIVLRQGGVRIDG